jgi:uncharacterized protein YeaC (DUF1315 family)
MTDINQVTEVDIQEYSGLSVQTKEHTLQNLVSNNAQHGLERETYQVYSGVDLSLSQKYQVLETFARVGDSLCKRVISEMESCDREESYLVGNRLAEKFLMRTIGFTEYYSALYGQLFFE